MMDHRDTMNTEKANVCIRSHSLAPNSPAKVLRVYGRLHPAPPTTSHQSLPAPAVHQNRLD